MDVHGAIIAYADGNPVDVLRAYPVLDKPATRLLAERLFPGALVEEADDALLADALNPPDDVVYIGSYPNLDIVCHWALIGQRPSETAPVILAASERKSVRMLAMHSAAGWCAYGVWRDGTLVRAVSVCRDPGVIEDIGEPLDFEESGVAGDPLRLGEQALRSLLGFDLDPAATRLDDVDPELIPVVGYRITAAGTASADDARPPAAPRRP